ncbi:Uncharacterised protein [Legionella donaldsonii]|uniref:Uncharacterized protein n=1 Tax=Legionella donaldsonii TaxID=45060 RepID=A0A378J5H7_9GAMM|nr:hypothetical protein [Legionella donaldsonii]STX42177.1 Uncharacterised protein [Legionella donaldsonii]
MMKDVYAEQTYHLEKGPRNKSEATYDLEKIALAFLNESDHMITVFYNGRQELEVQIDDHTYNLTKILEHADFEHLEFADNALDGYVTFLRKKTNRYRPHLDEDREDDLDQLMQSAEPTKTVEFIENPTEKMTEEATEDLIEELIDDMTEDLTELTYVELADLELDEVGVAEKESGQKKDGFPTRKDFQTRDPEGIYDDLSYAEKLAVNIYTTPAYHLINAFLRTRGKSENLRKLPLRELAQQVQETILVCCIAAQGLNKIDLQSPEGGDESVKLEKLNRFEKKSDMEAVFQERVNAVKKKRKEKKQEAFISSSLKDDINFSRYDTYVTIYQPFGKNPLGKRVELLADLKKEREVLFTPGTQLKFYEYRNKEKHHYFAAIPVRSLDTAAESLRYSAKNIAIRDELIKLHEELAQALDTYQRERKPAKTGFFSKIHFISSKKILQKIDGLIDFLAVSNPLDQASYLKKLQEVKKLISEELIKVSKINPSESNKHIQTVVLAMRDVNQQVEEQIQWANKRFSERVEPARLLADMKKLDKKVRARIEETTDAVANIQKIKTICADRYSDKVYYGNAALNRKILLDKEIADLLTPETMALIFDEHQQLKKQGKLSPEDSIAIRRDEKENDTYISLADALLFGFKDGLHVIEHLPNNEKRYGPKEYDEQKKSFRENTRRIIENLLNASRLFGLNPNATKYQHQENDSSFLPLGRRFAQIEMVIGLIKRDSKGDDLVFVPGFEAAHIRSQCVRGFRNICQIKEDAPNSYVVVEKGITSLNDLVSKFISDPGLLFDSSISHLLYDRVHFEACLEQDTILRIGKNEYRLADFFREVIKLCASSPDYYAAQEQFDLRMHLVEAHLQDKFPKQWKQGAGLINQPPKDDVPNLLTM